MRLRLPPYESVKQFDGKGNYAVKRYYTWPYAFFYRMKLRLITKYLTSHFRILDFGCGDAKIFYNELKCHATHVVCKDKYDRVDLRSKFDVIVFASVLEFVQNVQTTLVTLKKTLVRTGFICGASVCDNWLTRFYFKVIGDKERRRSITDIRTSILRHFDIVHEGTWLGLYWHFKAVPKW